jgi:xanthine dehydrogenase accessory factor
MNKELEIWQFVADRLKQNESVTLLVVAESAGSSPGRVGFKMAVAGDELRGSIGGGVMEVRLVEQARAVLEEKKRRGEEEKSGFITSQVHQKNSPNPSGMICSGRQTVIFYKLNSKDLKTVGAIIRALKSRQPKILCISDSKFQISDKQSEEFDFKFVRQGENDFFYEEKLGCKNRLFIVGGGHCALALSEIAAKMDFHIALFDDRPNLNTLEKNKFVNEKKIIESYEKIDEFIASGANVYVVVMTLGYKSDEVVIRKLLDKDFKYFGVLGSKAKMAALLRNLRSEGFSAEKLDKIRTPIGLPINSQTPEEIAISIAAEIIAVKNSKD